ncbi:MAG: 16S rRNA (guanine(966)-N(2))-methyltransferase RsmD [Candidatus Bipolaricaulaceae bacterium]
MRIIGGEHRGRRLVHWQDADIRPLRDRVRTALFDTLGEAVRGARVLDLFAGTGAVALEALSRGAAGATLVDSSAKAVRIIRANVRALGYQDRVEVIQGDAVKAVEELARQGRRYDFVFVGAPYTAPELTLSALWALAAHTPLRPGAWVVVESFHKEQPADVFPPLTQVSSRVYGETRLTYYRFGEKEGGR